MSSAGIQKSPLPVSKSTKHACGGFPIRTLPAHSCSLPSSRSLPLSLRKPRRGRPPGQRLACIGVVVGCTCRILAARSTKIHQRGLRVGASCLLTLLLVRAAIAARPGRRFRRSPHARSQPLAASLGSRLARQHRAIACIRIRRDSQGTLTTPSSSGRDPTAGLASSSAATKASSRWTVESSTGGERGRRQRDVVAASSESLFEQRDTGGGWTEMTWTERACWALCCSVECSGVVWTAQRSC
jgi:hypothetical protein